MPKSKQQKLDEYYQNRGHIVGSEAWLTDEELETKRRIEELEDPNHPHIVLMGIFVGKSKRVF
ncbi:hypothetical protein DUG81_05775 [Vibrio parahaemolyticus]|uniref:hypothetical protein n=1 Tax=Vibrio parahaemolyticus TaxID=670 RepID=UPI00165D9D2A|nr:hypothetical protein [Vibrio parahaemolyticus]EGR2691065.1 hypothetical protein [Vibrio parahaemolyticus]EGR2706685.1 hypothetical protein [Vibrio parahaemolyticus]